MHQSMSESRDLSSPACSRVSTNLPEANADASNEPTLPASCWSPLTGKSMRSRLFRNESGVWVAARWYSPKVLMHALWLGMWESC